MCIAMCIAEGLVVQTAPGSSVAEVFCPISGQHHQRNPVDRGLLADESENRTPLLCLPDATRQCRYSADRTHKLTLLDAI
jgi:hypothetical protein